MPVYAYVVTDKLLIIDTATNIVVDTIDIAPAGIAITLDGNFLYGTHYLGYKVSVISTCTNTVINTIPLPISSYPVGIAITPNGNYAYVVDSGALNENASVVVIDTSTNTVIKFIPVGMQATNIAITPDGHYAYVNNTQSDNVSVIDTNTNTVVDTIPVGDGPSSIAITPNGAFAYVTNTESNNLSVIDTSTNTVVDTIAVGPSPTDIAMTPNGKLAYVTSPIYGPNDPSEVFVIDLTTNKQIATVPVGNFALGIAITPDGNFVYVTNLASNNISIISTNTNTVVDTIPVEFGPTTIEIASVPSLEPEIDLKITKKDFPDPITLGENINYTIKVINNGQCTANNVTLVDTLPEDVDFISVSSTQGTCIESNGVVTCDFETMDMGNIVTVNITVKPRTTGTICNKAVVSSNGSSNSTNNTVFQCTTVLDSVCIETKKIFDSCFFEEEHYRIFRFPCAIRNQDIQCRVIRTEWDILDITKINNENNLVDVKLRIKVYLMFYSNGYYYRGFQRIICFDKNVTLTSPESADISFKINDVTCECTESNYVEKEPNNNMYFNKIYCTIKVAGTVKSSKFVEIKIPFLSDCTPTPCE